MALVSATRIRGCIVGYEDEGDADSPCVLFFAGGLHSRHFRHPDAVADVRVVSVDRPGYGLTEPCSLAEWPALMARLLDHLGVEAAGVAGHSAGGRFALGCSAASPARFPRVVLAAPEPELTSMDHHPMRALYEMAVAEPDAARDVIESLLSAGLADLDATVDRHVEQYGLTAVGSDPRLRAVYRASLREAARQGTAGILSDLLQSGRPWPFDIAAVTVPVTVYAGAQDTLVSPELLEKLTTGLPRARLVTVNAGHDVPFVVWEDIMRRAAESTANDSRRHAASPDEGSNDPHRDPSHSLSHNTAR